METIGDIGKLSSFGIYRAADVELLRRERVRVSGLLALRAFWQTMVDLVSLYLGPCWIQFYIFVII